MVLTHKVEKQSIPGIGYRHIAFVSNVRPERIRSMEIEQTCMISHFPELYDFG